MAKLQKPAYVFMGGKLTTWDQANLHIGSEALIRGISVFEGIKAYWRHDESHMSLLALEEHYQRLARSAHLQHLPFTMSYTEFTESCLLLARTLMTKERDLWLRTTLFAREGNWGEDTVSDLVITCYQQDKKSQEPMAVGVSTWQRPSDTSFPARMKSAANYQVSRIARIEGRQQGFADMILLNPAGRVAEASASCVLMVRDGRVSTPPTWEGCLESITIDIVEALCGTLKIPFERRPIERTELLVADELALAGTLMELGLIHNFAGRAMPADKPILDRVIDEYWACARGKREHPAVKLTLVS